MNYVIYGMCEVKSYTKDVAKTEPFRTVYVPHVETIVKTEFKKIKTVFVSSPLRVGSEILLDDKRGRVLEIIHDLNEDALRVHSTLLLSCVEEGTYEDAYDEASAEAARLNRLCSSRENRLLSWLSRLLDKS